MKVAGHVLDITHKIEHEISLKEKNQKFEGIIHILAHELMGPLGNIMNFAELQQTTDDPNELQSYAMIIKRISRESNGLISSMIELVELESEKFRLDTEECDLKIFLEMAVSQFVNQAKEKNIGITTGFADEVKLPLDMIKFKLVVHNLLSNAIKFTEEGGSIEISMKKEDGAINISYKDTGIGIPPLKQKCLFEKFSGARRKGLRGEKSTGLGLSIAKKIINLHEGRIDVCGEVGRGSTFTIRLPLKINGQRTGNGADFISPENINEKKDMT